MQREVLALFPLIPSVVVPGSQVVSSYTDAEWYPADLCMALSFLVPSLGDSHCLNLSGLSAPFPHPGVSASFHLGSPSLYHILGTLNTASWDNHRFTLFVFHLSGTNFLHCLMTNILKIIVSYILSDLFWVRGLILVQIL